MSRVTLGLDETLNTYIAGCGDSEHPVATRLRNLTAGMANGEMQIAIEQAQFLAFLIRLTGARNVLEIGTFCGYSALWMALALPADGTLVACDVSQEWTAIGQRHWRDAGVANRIDLRIGPAAQTMETLKHEGPPDRFDFIFIDADKTGYDEYYERSLGLLKSGGIIVFDNMLQGGAVADRDRSQGAAASIRALNARIASDQRVNKVLIPIGDGMSLVRKI